MDMKAEELLDRIEMELRRKGKPGEDYSIIHKIIKKNCMFLIIKYASEISQDKCSSCIYSGIMNSNQEDK